MLISKVSGLGFNGKNINPKEVQSTAEKIYSHGANLEKSLITNESNVSGIGADTYYPFASLTGNGYLTKPKKITQDNVKNKVYEYLSDSMILEKDAKKKV